MIKALIFIPIILFIIYASPIGYEIYNKTNSIAQYRKSFKSKCDIGFEIKEFNDASKIKLYRMKYEKDSFHSASTEDMIVKRIIGLATRRQSDFTIKTILASKLLSVMNSKEHNRLLYLNTVFLGKAEEKNCQIIGFQEGATLYLKKEFENLTL